MRNIRKKLLTHLGCLTITSPLCTITNWRFRAMADRQLYPGTIRPRLGRGRLLIFWILIGYLRCSTYPLTPNSRYKLSDVDALKINRLYRCEGPTPESQIGDFDKAKARRLLLTTTPRSATTPQRPAVITSSEELTKSSERGSRTSAGFSRFVI